MNSIFRRTSVRQYTDEPVDAQEIELMLRAAMQAPSAVNQQPWEYYVVTNPTVQQQLAETSPYVTPVRTAPVTFVACYRSDCVLPECVFMDMGASVENLLLEADHLGLGGVWMAVAPFEDRQEATARIIGAADGLVPFALISVGHPLTQPQQTSRYDPARVHHID